MEHRFSSLDDFRLRAEEADYKELEGYILSLENRSTDFKNGPYPFSYTTAAKMLREKGYLGGNKESGEAGDTPRKFVLEYERGQGTPKYATRSFSVERDVLAELDRLCRDYGRYPKKECINKIIADGLALYGYVPGREAQKNE